MMALVALLSVFTVNCGRDKETDKPDVTDNASLRFIHASPDVPEVDIYADDLETPLVSGVKYGDTTNYLPLAASSHVFHFRPAGGGAELPPLFSSAAIRLESSKPMNAVITGLLEEGSLDKSLRILPLVEDFAPSAPGMIRIRILHAGVDAPTLGIDLDGDGAPEVREFARFEDSGIAGLELEANKPLSIALTIDGTPSAAFSLPPQPEETELLVVVTGLRSIPPRLEKGLMLFVTNEAGRVGLIQQDPQVYVMNATELPEELEVFLGENEQAEAISFGELSSVIHVRPGSDTLAFFPSAPTSNRPSGAPLLAYPASELEMGERYLFVVTSRPSSSIEPAPEFRLLTLPESFAVDEENPRFQFVHAAPSLSAVDVSPLDTQRLMPAELEINDLAYTQASAPEGLPLPTVEFTLGVRLADNVSEEPMTEFYIGPGPLTAGGVFGVLATQNETQKRLILVNTRESPWTAQVLDPNDSESLSYHEDSSAEQIRAREQARAR
ncbi:hypothetical protein BON30_05970 [Cystobacter ferrugineus]|uniref:DUF4397 domain-containing protein n=2 Tax=Cystobacter ferrugineus TaxID=83449 RepID=A0A1L9BK81_9BACT|nr:hypothetical protein BON30_05970 [Cystobacter ferrugineus]